MSWVTNEGRRPKSIFVYIHKAIARLVGGAWPRAEEPTIRQEIGRGRVNDQSRALVVWQAGRVGAGLVAIQMGWYL